MRTHVVVGLTVLALGCGSDDEPAPVAEIACVPATAWVAPVTQLLQRATTVIVFRNDGAPGTVSLALDGADAEDFALSPITDCDEGRRLGTGDLCFVQVDFAPTSLGPKQASLRVGATRLALTGTAIATTNSLFIGAANLSFSRGAVAIGLSEFIVSNQGTTPIALGAPTFSGTGFVGNTASDCGPMLTAGGACRMQVAYSPTTRGCAAGAMHLGGLDVPVDGRFLGGVEVYARGAGTGTITSSPAGIDCSTGDVGVCARAFDADRVTLTATPTNGSFLVGPSATRTIEILPWDITRNWYVQFASPAAKAISLTLDGDARGTVDNFMTTSTCTDDCTLHAEPGDYVQLTARTPSRFLGWSGACVGTSPTCELGLTVNDRAATATFAKDDGEVATLLPAVPASVAAFYADGDLLVVGPSGSAEVPLLIASRLSPTGAVRWSRTIATTLEWSRDLVTTASGAAYLFTTAPDVSRATLFRLDDSGAVVWTRPLPANAFPSSFDTMLAPIGDDLALVWADEVAVRAAADGAVRWRSPLDTPLAIAASATELAVARHDFESGPIVIERFALDGTPRGTPSLAAGRFDSVVLAYDHDGGVVVASGPAITRFDATGTTTFTVPETDLTTYRYLTVTSAGRIVSARSHRYRYRYDYDAGALVLAHDPTGVERWRLDKEAAGGGDPHDAQFSGVGLTDLISDRQGHVALIGNYAAGPWIEILAIP